MQEPLYVFVDVSGSMFEMAKIHIQKNICRFITALPLVDPSNYGRFDLHFYRWSNSIEEISLEEDGSFPVLEASGRADLSSLGFFLEEMACREEEKGLLRVLLLTEGLFRSNDLEAFSKKMRSLSSLLLRVVAIGADAPVERVRSIATNGVAWLPEDIPAAMESLCFSQDGAPAPPKCVKDILRDSK
jgi:hypothetical protein